MSIAISSGHGLHVRGARGVLDERDENVRVTDRVAAILRSRGVACAVFHDNTSRTVSANIGAIVNWHNRQSRTRDVSVHFNAHRQTTQPVGTECLHRNQPALAAQVSAAMARGGGFRNRGAKQRSNLGFLNRAARPAVLLEVCFVDSTADAALYRQHFERICQEIASAISPGSGGGTVSPPAGSRPVLRQGSRGVEVIELQRLLNNRGERLATDGIFGPLTNAAVRRFQTAQRIGVDGIVGPITWGRLLA